MTRIISRLLPLIALLLSTGALAQETDFTKLPLSIDTPDNSELVPVISVDGKTLFFTRPRLALDGSTVLDIWRAGISGDSAYSDPIVLGQSLSSRFGIAVTSVAPDNNTLYLMGKMEEDVPPDERIYITHRNNTGWTTPERIHIRNLNLRGYFTDYSFGPDQKTLLMAVLRDSSLGDRDLYASFLDEQRGQWSTPLWLGPTVNSKWTELTPYLAADNKTLYFSSNRPGGIGEIDVYRSVRLDDSWQHWSEPEDLGPHINRPGRNTYYTEDAQGKYAYLCWRKDAQDQSDIYRVNVQRQKATAVALVHGTVTNLDHHPRAAQIRYERLSDGKEMGTARSDPRTGEYQITLPAGEEYAIHAELTGYLATSEHFDFRTLKDFEKVEKDLLLTPIKRGASIELHSIFFETDKTELLPNSFPELQRLKQFLITSPGVSVSIDGYTDSIGSAAHNKALSKGRAQAVSDYLSQEGIDPARLKVVGYGADNPVSTNTTEEGRARNRRVGFTVTEDSPSIKP